MTKVEEVARAIHARMKAGGAYRYEYEVDGHSFRELARAAIEAMREPSEAMIDATSETQGRGVRAAYIAMIDAALKETP